MDFQLPQLGEGVYEAELVRWLVKPGDTVKRGQPLLEVLTDKATMEVPSPFIGTIGSLKGEPGQQVKVGDVVLTYTGSDNAAVAQPASAPAQTPVLVGRGEERSNGASATRAAGRTPVRAAPSVRLMARKLGIELESVHGSGPDGRVLHDDLTAVVQRMAAVRGESRESPPRAIPRPDYGKPGTRLKLVGLRRKIADHMAHSKRTIPHYSYVEECDVTDLVRLRESLKDVYARGGVKLTYLAFFVKAVVQALKEVPLVNASLDEKAGEIVLHDRYHVGIAVATSGGLIVPVVKDADKKDLGTIAREIDRLSSEARAGKSKLDDLRGGTFTVTSVGSIGGLISTPVINHPEVGILGLGKVVKRPVFDDRGQIKAADLIYLSLSFDHRVVDGAVGAVFCNAVLKPLQNPATMLLPEKP